MLDHMTDFGFMATGLSLIRWLKAILLQKPHTKNTAQRAIVLVFNERTNAKIALYIYLRLTLGGNYVGWGEVMAPREYSIARSFR